MKRPFDEKQATADLETMNLDAWVEKWVNQPLVEWAQNLGTPAKKIGDTIKVKIPRRFQ